ARRAVRFRLGRRAIRYRLGRRAVRIRLGRRWAAERNEKAERRENRARPWLVQHRPWGGGARGAEKIGKTDRRSRQLQRLASGDWGARDRERHWPPHRAAAQRELDVVASRRRRDGPGAARRGLQNQEAETE